jgi:L-methionine (R)-S-oxide reductase
MSELLAINKNLSDEEIYKALIPITKALLNPLGPWYSNLSNMTAVLKESFSKISWVGFYILKDKKLFLGPFQGKTACTMIELGKGVCGTAALRKATVIVEDVNSFTGHIACDSESRSEIVVPLIENGNIYGVLDLDSYKCSSFNEIDKNYLEEICKIIVENISTNFKSFN